MNRYLVLLTLLGFPVHAQDSQVIIESDDGYGVHQVQPGEVCRRDIDGSLVCTQVYTPEPVEIEPPAPQLYQAWWPLSPQPNPKPTIHTMFCARTQEHALAGFVANMHTANLNKVAESYYWNGISGDDSEAILTALASVPIDGAWESSVMMDGLGGIRSHNRALRWKPNDPAKPSTPFVLREDQGCWFVQFGAGVVSYTSTASMPASTPKERVMAGVERIQEEIQELVPDRPAPQPQPSYPSTDGTGDRYLYEEVPLERTLEQRPVERRPEEFEQESRVIIER